ncbi:hypothetical protein KUTeg_012982 [Tegillarca granosa]|uniref:Ribosomal protein S6 kinase delta-1 n=1 Tax=Tegillarca granosa TaxID=220873 RepID=A0ABQ9ESC9_TEGGR|nr:hypothetical protein KUTeg_012982 [Tegillarca granosa]
MMASRQKHKRERIWNFEVSDPTLHPNGFTIYKITCKVFTVTVPDSLTEVIVWKRYNDFKQLYKAMYSLHKALHRKEEFPPFAKPKRTSALNLLNFIGQHSYLYHHRTFLEFFEGGQKTSGSSGEILKPSKLDILNTDKTGDDEKNQDTLQPIKHPPETSSANLELPTVDRAPSPSNQEQSDSNEMQLEGVWNFRQVPDNISLNSYEDTDEASVTDVESALGTPLPDAELSFFDPLHNDDLTGTPELRTSSSWLFAAMNTCAGMDEDVPPSPKHSVTDGGIQIDFLDSMESSIDDIPTPVNDQNDFINSSSTVDITDFDPLKPRSESKVECGKGDLDLFATRSIDSSVGSGSTCSSAISSPRSQSSLSPRRQTNRMRSVTNESVSTMDLGGREDYIYLAANKICLAQECEASGKYAEAFGHYKSGVGILLQGVQGDRNKSRRDAVRRKTAQYLLKAEDLYNRHLAHETVDERRWATDSMLSPSTELDPSLTFIKAPISELKNFKVLGTVDKVLLVMDKSSDETYIIKTVHKSSTFNRRLKSILPTSCPHMVNLHKFYETDNAMYLLLQYACGGKLWNYISGYLQHNRGFNKDFMPNQNGLADVHGNVYSGHKCHDADPSNKLPPGIQEDRTKSKLQSDTPGLNSLSNSEVQFSKERTRYIDNEIVDRPSMSTSDHNKFSNGHTGISVGADDLKPEDFSFSHEHDSFISPEEESPSKVKFNRYISISSEETTDFNECDSTDLNSGSVEQRDIIFKELLQNNKTNLEHFSINSVESNEGIERKDSFLSDNIESIPEELEESPFSNMSDSDVSHENKVTKSDNLNDLDVKDADYIVQSAKELLKSVERTLSQTDIEVNEMITSSSIENVSNSTINNAHKSSQKINLLKSPKSSSVVNSCDTLVGDNDSNEVSIYDIHRSHDANSSSEESSDLYVDKSSISVINEPVKFEDKNDDVTKNSESDSGRKNTLTNRRMSSSDIQSDESQKHSRSSTLTDQSKQIVPPNKLSLTRMNSNELSRSASFDHELTSPSKTRQRTVSGVFQQLDLAATNSDQIRIPEACIQQWAAEIVVAVSILHSEGIICRDLKPKLKGITGYTDVCDWWSLGAILYELIVGKSLASCHPGGITPHTQLNIPDHVSPEAQGLLRQLLCYSPRERLGAGMNGSEEIKAHPFFNNINWNALET